MTAENSQNSRAIVIGAGFGGLLAAGALSPHFDEVLIIERDTMPTEPGGRTTIPQRHHLHIMLARGIANVHKIYPQYGDELLAQGAFTGDVGACATAAAPGGMRRLSVTIGVQDFYASRNAIEWAIRQCASRLPNVRIIDNTIVTGLATTDDRSTVTGVTTASETFLADLVVDSSGRAAHGPGWLEHIGYERPHETRVPVNVTYGTRRYKRDPVRHGSIYRISVAPTEDGHRGGVMIAQEDGTWIVTLSGFGNHRPELDEKKFHDFAKSFVAPDIADAITDAEPVDDGHRFKIPAIVWRDYKGTKLPRNYLPIGDTICSLNPIYAQGMTVASEEAVILADCLGAGRDDLTARFLTEADKFIGRVWNSTAPLDRRAMETTATPKKGARDVIMTAFGQAMASDPKVVEAFLRVNGLLDSPSKLTRPSILARVAWANRPWRRN